MKIFSNIHPVWFAVGLIGVGVALIAVGVAATSDRDDGLNDAAAV